MRNLARLIVALSIMIPLGFMASPASAEELSAVSGDDVGTMAAISVWVWDPDAGRYAGEGIFNQNPLGSAPGDSIAACDDASDGWYIRTRLDVGNNGSIDRSVSTAGRPAISCSDWATGNLTEGTVVAFYACMVRDTTVKNCTARVITRA